MHKLILAMIFLLSACVSVPSQSAGSVREAIDRHNASMVLWYAAGDIDSIASVFAEDAWQMPPNNPPLVGREAIRRFWQQATQWGKWEFALEATKVDVSGPMAVERGKYALKFTAGPGAPPGMVSFEDRGNYLVHWRHEADGEWRIVSDAPVSELPLIPFSDVPERITGKAEAERQSDQ